MTRYNRSDTEEDSIDENVIIHVIPETRNRWNHIENLDSFFTRIYLYHQNHGFICMVLQEALQLFQFAFVVGFSAVLYDCVNYDILFRRHEIARNGTKVTLSDVLAGPDECLASFSPMMWMFLLVALLCWILKFLSVIYHIVQYWDIRCFYLNALNIKDADLNNLTWHEIQQKLRQAQNDYQICIHKSDLTELDIYHRILRFQNFMVALVNKSILPLKFNVPILGNVVFLSQGLKFNIEFLLFYGPWAPFENSWHLRDDYKRPHRRREIANELSRHIGLFAIVNLVLSPLILLWQVLYAFFNYAELIKREPGSLGSRRWSFYGKLYLRHFNELDHELKARLCRAYRPANQYLSGFSSSVLAVIAQNVVFVAGAILAVLILLTIYDEDVITVEHVLTIMTLLGTAIAVCRAFIPDENLVWCPESLLEAVVAQVHYFPSEWKGKAHTIQVRTELEKLFQYKAMYLLEELLSPLLTPFILYFSLRPKAQEIVDFLRQFTVEVVGVGDVCSFAQLDLNKHGHPLWQINEDEVPEQSTRPNVMHSSAPNVRQAEHGKTELSLIHFALTNPDWRPPRNAEEFLSAIKNFLHSEPWLHPNIHSSCGLPGSHCAAAQSGIYGGAGKASHSRSAFTSGIARQDERRSFVDDKNIFSGSLDRALDPNVAREAAAISMAASTLLLHDIRHKRCPTDARPRPVALVPINMPEIQEDEEDVQASDNAAAALDTAIRNLSSNKNTGFSAL